jgi:hypothetical protein
MESAISISTTPHVRPGQQTALGTAATAATVNPTRPKAHDKSSNQLPSVLNPAPIKKLTYEHAISDILVKMDPHLGKIQPTQTIHTSVVLYDQNDAILKICDGLLLKSDVSLCYLITWLQIFADNFMARHNPGVELMVKSVEIRFFNKNVHKDYPGLEGQLYYSEGYPRAVAGISWPCDNSSMEQYWEAYRNLLQMGFDKNIKYPIIKIKTAKLPARDAQLKDSKKGLGGNHKFLVGKESLDVDLYFGKMGQEVPDSLVQLDNLLTEVHKKKVREDAWFTKERRPARYSTHKASACAKKEEGLQAGGNKSPSIIGSEPSAF